MAFDPNVFLNTSYETEFQEKRELVPVGDYFAIITDLPDVKLREPGQLMAKFRFLLLDEELCTAQNRDKIYVTQFIFLDVDEEDPNVLLYGTNQNIELGALRAALNQNDPAIPWNFQQLINATPILIHVEHRVMKNGDTIECVKSYASAD